MKKLQLIGWASLILMTACVPARKFEELQEKKRACEEQRSALKERNRELEERMTETEDEFAEMKKRMENLKLDTSIQGKSLRLMSQNYDQLNETYQLLLEKNKELLAGNASETKKLFGNLQDAQKELQRQQDALNQLEASLQTKEANLSRLKSELDQRAKRVEELEKVLSRKDSAVDALKNKVKNALLGFENNGLTIEERNGKVYVSLEESLLFASGSYNVNSKGTEVLKKLAKVLEQNNDINVLVEGHTDNVPFNGSGQLKDNWDLSVRRATSVTKIIIENSSLAPNRITAAGRGEHAPIAENDTKAGRSKNRRTEIILTPKLDELFKILETN